MNITAIRPLKIAVVGSGISGLSSAWLLSQQHQVTLFEKDDRLGGHSNTVDVPLGTGSVAVDTGFIVYNPVNYPNLVRFFETLGVQSRETDMSFGVSLDRGRLEYSGTGLPGLLAQKRNLARPRFWSMLLDLSRFYREAARYCEDPATASLTLGELLHRERYGHAFVQDHLLPMGAAIWSTPVDLMLEYPALAFLRFCQNHGLVQLNDRPQWRTVTGGSRSYVSKIDASLRQRGEVRLNSRIHRILRRKGGIELEFLHGEREPFDHVVLACHANQALQLLHAPSMLEQQLLGAFSYQRNRAVLHSDPSLMPRSKAAWASWNYLAALRHGGQREVSVSYWMNRLQHLPNALPLYVTLNPLHEPAPGTVHRSFLYDHPTFSLAALAAQKQLWNLQGQQNTWFCGAYFGSGFHEDGLQSGLAVAEELGGRPRPWTLETPNHRIYVHSSRGLPA
ncbi:NAD(P)/FAD-dependent oxidoreductase [Marinobacterium rhizophilum]|uniref:FAD-dependent oxidoreductase n=1 Tax=Marinobacterium rhizophilum TaxID=420402 RepID=A0ABY5HJI0_9GAMM|nr:FAD-dependent oxidoreductase [Marinobacterium rhizophilum]UTW12443.1 FAD-dependent oxidoreductase [Marinobacterium rhizophilum]